MKAGVPVEKLVKSWRASSSGCLRASAITAWVASFRAAEPRPVRSSTSNSNPPVAPRPGIDGGSKESAKAPGMPSSFGRTAATIFDACCDAGRSSQGLRMANSTAEFDWAALVRKLSPEIEPTISTPGSAWSTSRTWRATASVRSSEAPSGPWITTKK